MVDVNLILTLFTLLDKLFGRGRRFIREFSATYTCTCIYIHVMIGNQRFVPQYCYCNSLWRKWYVARQVGDNYTLTKYNRVWRTKEKNFYWTQATAVSLWHCRPRLLSRRPAVIVSFQHSSAADNLQELLPPSSGDHAALRQHFYIAYIWHAYLSRSQFGSRVPVQIRYA